MNLKTSTIFAKEGFYRPPRLFEKICKVNKFAWRYFLLDFTGGAKASFVPCGGNISLLFLSIYCGVSSLGSS